MSYVARFRISRPMLVISAAFLALAIAGFAAASPAWPWELAVLIGLTVPVKVVAPDGLICTAKFPAPVGSATV